MDALHCQKTAQAIVESGNGYVLQLKGNQKNLKIAVENIINHSEPIEVDRIKENRGRLEERIVHVYKNLNDLASDHQWPSVKRIIHAISK